MIEVKEVKTKKEQKAFIKFPIDLYKGNRFFVPSLNVDEKEIFNKNYSYYETCEAKYFIAYMDGKVVGRISAIYQKEANKKWNQNRIRFTRFDSINNKEVSNALFKACVDYGKSLGASEIVGPLGFSDLEREGLLIEGFDQLSTYEEEYNYDYYQDLIESYGFKKEIDWLEHKLYTPKVFDNRRYEISKKMLDRLNLKFVLCKSMKEYISRYSNEVFELIDKTYFNIYGTVPITDRVKKQLVKDFALICKSEMLGLVIDSEGRIVCCAIAWRSISKAVNKSKGKLTPSSIIRILHSKNHSKVIDFALIGVKKEYEMTGVASNLIYEIQKYMIEHKIEYAESNLTLEDNTHILNLFSCFDKVCHKKRRSYIKEIK